MRVLADGTIMAHQAKFSGGFKSYNGLVEITDYQTPDGSYTWNGVSVKYDDAARHDMATFGVRYISGGVSYARAVFGRRNANGTYDTPIEISAEEGSVKAESIRAGKNLILNTNRTISTSGNLDGSDAVTDANIQMIICTASGDQTIQLSSTPTNGTIIIIKKTTNSGYVEVKNASNSVIGRFAEGSIICMYDNGWEQYEYEEYELHHRRQAGLSQRCREGVDAHVEQYALDAPDERAAEHPAQHTPQRHPRRGKHVALGLRLRAGLPDGGASRVPVCPGLPDEVAESAVISLRNHRDFLQKLP
jgi:hypothetical protein